MELTERIEDALRKSLGAEYVRLENDDGISGFVVSRHFENLSALERQEQIDNALREAAQPLSAEGLIKAWLRERDIAPLHARTDGCKGRCRCRCSLRVSLQSGEHHRYPPKHSACHI